MVIAVINITGKRTAMRIEAIKNTDVKEIKIKIGIELEPLYWGFRRNRKI